jgi:hypothetical protein
MESLSTIVLFLVVVAFFQSVTNYTVGFITAINERIHERIIRKQRRWADRIIKKL